MDHSAPIRRRCLLHLSIGLPIGGEERFQNPNATLQGPSLSNSSNGSYRTDPHAASITSGVRMARLLSSAVAASDACGTENENVAPGPLFSVAHSRP